MQTDLENALRKEFLGIDVDRNGEIDKKEMKEYLIDKLVKTMRDQA